LEAVAAAISQGRRMTHAASLIGITQAAVKKTTEATATPMAGAVQMRANRGRSRNAQRLAGSPRRPRTTTVVRVWRTKITLTPADGTSHHELSTTNVWGVRHVVHINGLGLSWSAQRSEYWSVVCPQWRLLVLEPGGVNAGPKLDPYCRLKVASPSALLVFLLGFGVALTPLRGRLVREDVHYGKHASGVRP
jgi:hypothetical protein